MNSPRQTRAQVRANLDAAVASLEASRTAFKCGQYPRQRELLSDALACLRAANAITARHQSPITNHQSPITNPKGN